MKWIVTEQFEDSIVGYVYASCSLEASKKAYKRFPEYLSLVVKEA